MLPIDEKTSTDLKTALDPYMLEAGLDPDQLSFSQNRKLVVESLPLGKQPYFIFVLWLF